MQFVRVNDITLHFQEIGGPAGAPAVVFVNSIGSDFRIWRDVVVRLAGKFRIVLYDFRGHGLSDTGAAPYAVADHAADLAGLIDQLLIEKAIVVGLSVGGQIALGLSELRPDLLAGLVLCDTGHRIGTRERWADRIATVEAGGTGSIAGAAMDVWFTPAFHKSHPDEVAGYRNMVARQDDAGYSGTCAALRDADLTAAAKAVKVPALCIAGAEDSATPPALLKELAALIPGASYAEIAGGAHLPQIEQPDRFAELVADFAGNLPKQGSADGK